jgi:hypothetical protein
MKEIPYSNYYDMMEWNFESCLQLKAMKLSVLPIEMAINLPVPGYSRDDFREMTTTLTMVGRSKITSGEN